MIIWKFFFFFFVFLVVYTLWGGELFELFLVLYFARSSPKPPHLPSIHPSNTHFYYFFNSNLERTAKKTKNFLTLWFDMRMGEITFRQWKFWIVKIHLFSYSFQLNLILFRLGIFKWTRIRWMVLRHKNAGLDQLHQPLRCSSGSNKT